MILLLVIICCLRIRRHKRAKCRVKRRCDEEKLHDINQAIHFSDQIIGLAAGKVLVKGAPGNVISAECIQKLYGIELGVTEIDGKKFVLTV